MKRLQQFLNAHGAVLASQGGGAPGYETDFFGALTYRALIHFQEMHADAILKPVGLTTGTGFFGSLTRAYVNAVTE